MEPNYANYSYNELLEALETIDHHAYPERVDSIKARLATLTQNSTSASKLRTALAHLFAETTKILASYYFYLVR